MYLQQVWTIRHNWKVWWPLYPLTQHHQWKGEQFYFPSFLIFSILSDLCSALVLVCVSVHCLCHPTYLENIIHNIKKNKRVHPQETDSWVCSGKTATKSNLCIQLIYLTLARACCHLLCQAQHGRLVHPPAGGGKCGCPRVFRPREASWDGSQEDAWHTSRHL